jgi:hypothetical protein
MSPVIERWIAGCGLVFVLLALDVLAHTDSVHAQTRSSITVSATTVAAGATVTVRVANGPGTLRDWVGVAPAAAPDRSFVQWKYLSNTQSAPSTGLAAATLTFTMPSSPGVYQLRFFANDGFTRLATSANVSVGGTSGTPVPPTSSKEPAIRVNTTTTTPGAPVSVTVTNGPGNPKDWVGLAAASAPNGSFLQWKYLTNTHAPAPPGVSAATLTFTMPPTAGVYQFRVFANDGFTRLATSADVTVSAVASPGPPPSSPTPPSPTPPSPTPSTAYEGFGRVTRGGEGQPVYRVTNLNDSGPGSLRDALSRGNRYVVFDVGGTINLTSHEFLGDWYYAGLWVKGPYVTIDGTTAPAPGITITSSTLPNVGNSGVEGLAIDHHITGAHDVVVKGIRFRNITSPSATCLGIASYNVVVDHVSTYMCGKNSIDIYGDSVNLVHDITVQWSIIGPNNPSHNIALDINRNEWNISLHHNLIIDLTGRMPKISRDQRPTSATTVDMRNNVVWDWNGSRATTILEGANVNVINNLYYTPPGTGGIEWGLQVCTGEAEGTCPAGLQYAASAFTDGNVSLNTGSSPEGGSWSDFYDRRGNRSTPFSAAFVTTTDACTAARAVVAVAGVRPLDTVDQNLVRQVNLSSCP